MARASLPLLALATLAVWSHPALDWLNTYGVRFLAPFDWTWFYGDSVFIVDPWLWLVLGAAAWAPWREPRGRERLAAAGLAVAALYVGFLFAAGRAGRAVVREHVAEERSGPIVDLMVGPRIVDPLRREVVVATEAGYRLGRLRGLELDLAPQIVPRIVPETLPGLVAEPVVAAALADPSVAGMAGWMRFPTFWVEERADGGYRVDVVDLRYARRPDSGFGTARVELPRARAVAGQPSAQSP